MMLLRLHHTERSGTTEILRARGCVLYADGVRDSGHKIRLRSRLVTVLVSRLAHPGRRAHK